MELPTNQTPENTRQLTPDNAKHLWVAVTFAYHTPDLIPDMLIFPVWAEDPADATRIADAQNLRLHDPSAGWLGHLVRAEMVADAVVLQAADAILHDPVAASGSIVEGIQTTDIALPGGDVRAGNFPGRFGAPDPYKLRLSDNPVLAFPPK